MLSLLYSTGAKISLSDEIMSFGSDIDGSSA